MISGEPEDSTTWTKYAAARSLRSACAGVMATSRGLRTSVRLHRDLQAFNFGRMHLAQAIYHHFVRVQSSA